MDRPISVTSADSPVRRRTNRSSHSTMRPPLSLVSILPVIISATTPLPWVSSPRSRSNFIEHVVSRLHGGDQQVDWPSKVVQEIEDCTDFRPLTYPTNVDEAANDFSKESGMKAYRFLRGLASSAAFRNQFWHKKPLLLRSEMVGGWSQGTFTVERDLRYAL